MRTIDSFVSLWSWGAAIFLLFGIVFAVLSSYVSQENQSIYTIYIEVDYNKTTLREREYIIHKGSLFYILPCIVANLFIECVVTFLIPILLVKCWSYRTYIEMNYHPIRWISYSITASLQTSCLGFYCGVVDRSAILGLFFLTLVAMQCGHLIELYPGDLHILIFGWAVYGCRVVVLWTAFFQNASEAPGFVYAMFILNELLYAGFGIIGCIYYKYYARNMEFYYKIERAYAVFSFFAKTVINSIAAGQPLSKTGL